MRFPVLNLGVAISNSAESVTATSLFVEAESAHLPLSRWSDLIEWVTGLWLFGSLVLSLFVFRSDVRGRRLQSSGVVVDSPMLTFVLRRTISQLGLRRVPDVYTSDRVYAPLVSGVWAFVPIHFLLRELDAAREDICDNEVLRRFDPVVYAKTLLDIGRRSSLELGLMRSPLRNR